MAYCYDINVKKTTLTTMYNIKTKFALMLVSAVLFKIVEMKYHINFNIRNRPKDLELHGHKRCLIFQRSLWSCFLHFWKENKNTSKTNPVYWRFWCLECLFNINLNRSDWLKCKWQPCCLLYCIPDKSSDPLWENGLQLSISPATNMVNWNNAMQTHHLQLYFVLVSPQIIGSGFMDLQHC